MSSTNPIPLLCASILIASCASQKPYELDLMPSPDLYAEAGADPFMQVDPGESIPWRRILYATDRVPAAGLADPFYENERGHVLRLGVGRVELDTDESITWEQLREISLLKNRTDRFPLNVAEVSELGVLADTYTAFLPHTLLPGDPAAPRREFARLVNERLASARDKDIFIYVHGYKVNFENPLLVAAEMWHFLGYEGVFVAYAWPSTPETLAYAGDLETTSYSARNLRLFVEYLARETDAERIHIVGYSAGTHLVNKTLHQMALLTHHLPEQEARGRHKLGHVILVASDVDPAVFLATLADGGKRISEVITLYESRSDKALDLSKRLLGRTRLGQVITEALPGPIAAYLADHHDIVLVDVGNAPNIEAGHGHAYFRQSPWVSSDLLLSLRYRVPPAERGLVPREDHAVWGFPSDYDARLIETIRRLNPSL